MENVTRIMVSPDMNFYDAVTHNLVEMISNPMNQMVFITIYRCNKKSPIITALAKAAKQIPVFAYVEPKASGMHDENKSLAKYLRKEGCHVLCGMKESPNDLLKDFCKTRRVHFKACLCIADEATEAFYSTGNFILPQRNHAEDFSVRINVKEDPNIIRCLGGSFDAIFDLKSSYPDLFEELYPAIIRWRLTLTESPQFTFSTIPMGIGIFSMISVKIPEIDLENWIFESKLGI